MHFQSKISCGGKTSISEWYLVIVQRSMLSRSYIKRFVWYNLYDRQSVFRFSLCFNFQTRCSYQVHKRCLYIVFSLQEFKKNESRTSCSSSNCCVKLLESLRIQSECGKIGTIKNSVFGHISHSDYCTKGKETKRKVGMKSYDFMELCL